MMESSWRRVVEEVASGDISFVNIQRRSAALVWC